MYQDSLTALIVFYTRKHRFYIAIAAIIVLVIYVKSADYRSTSNTPAIIEQMQTYISPYPSFTKLRDGNAFLRGLGAKDRNPALHYDWTFYSDDSLENIRTFYKNDLQQRGYEIERTTPNSYSSKKGKLHVRIVYSDKGDERMISIIIYDEASLQQR